MDENTFMLVSMKDSKSVADALSNKTAQKILKYLTENKESTESELAEKLEIPLPTVHYNIKQLRNAKLIKSKEFFWSKKGKKMKIFTIAKKFIIISPDSSERTLSKLKNILPVTLLSFIGAGAIHFYQTSKQGAMDIIASDIPAMKIVPMAGKSAASECVAPITQEPNLALWFLAGALIAIGAGSLFAIANNFKQK
ncbi:helix-turn-helix domain-containing protein [Candidatus Woesearchaeota archaeon]|jgi:DNA-binding transcriptional ArsR family regulator|nr:helix-turn-helix domain-containing protein [Candidatus Woesearchaeota archaeon]MBT4835692.1 helix-turn-helix domain-containing protein [Candidatus Woesearchaeota archaeon]MBT6735314.1 helix-turn-helix domain-containing protein [Candidatus Woesearchaeota archaeon]MBT7169486.1 helix-turn-helix domain-containing protein [Candidatus Woesearchaeota archaeon]MBT7474696.1 helix-turn-helix domain-containing protein [Candidatus Woesearchaeota archaeon]